MTHGGAHAMRRRALEAWQRGAFDELRAIVEETRPSALGAALRLESAAERQEQSALDTLAWAVTGSLAQCEAGAAEVRSAASPIAACLARVELAVAIALHRSGAGARLDSHLRVHAGAIIDQGTPLERLLVRALEASRRAPFGDGGDTSDATGTLETEIPGSGAWIERVAPGCGGAIVEAARPVEGDGVFRSSFGPGKRAPRDEQTPADAWDAPMIGGRQAVLVWVALLGVFFAIWSAFHGRSEANSAPSARYGLSAIATTAVVLALVVHRALASRQPAVDLEPIAVALMYDRLEEVDALLIGADANGDVAVLGKLALMRAELAERRGDLSRALREIEAAARPVDGESARMAALRIAPRGARFARRALALAALGRAANAHAQLTELAPLSASDPEFEVVAFSTELIAYANAGELEPACALLKRYGAARARPARIEALGMLVRAATGETHARALLRRELKLRPAWARWLRAVAGAWMSVAMLSAV